MRNKTIFLLIILLSIINISFSQRKYESSKIETVSENIFGIAITKGGNILAIGDNKDIKFYSTQTLELLETINGAHDAEILALDFSGDSSLMVSSGRDHQLIIWDLHRQKLKTIHNPDGIMLTVHLSNNYLFAGGTDHKIYVYDVSDFELVKTFEEHTGDVLSLDISSDENFLASASADRKINIYDLNNLKFLVTLSDHRSWVRDVSFSHDGSELASCGDDSKIIIWDLSNINDVKIKSISTHGTSWILHVDYFKDNNTYAFGNIAGKISIHGSTFSYNQNIGKAINDLLFKPDEDIYIKIIVATRGMGVLILEAKNMKSKLNKK